MLRPKNGGWPKANSRSSREARSFDGWKRTKEPQPGPLRGIAEWDAPGAAKEFPPWVVSAYRIAVKHGFTGTEREFREGLCGGPGIDQLPMLLVTEEPESEIPDDYEAIMRPSPDVYAYYTERNEFRAADEEAKVPDGLSLTGGMLMLSCEGAPFGEGAVLPSAELPEVTASDNGKVMKVVSGAWAAGTL